MEKIYDIIVIGGGPAGLSAGIYGGRAKLDVLILEKEKAGGQITITNDVVNYPGILQMTGAEFGEEATKQAKAFGVEFKKEEVLEMNFSQDVKVIKTNANEYKALSVILATGAEPRKLGFPGEKEFAGRGVAYCATCDGEFFTGLPVFVVGAGFAAAEEAMFLTKFASKVTIIAREPEFTCAKSIADKVKAHPKIEVRFNTELVEAGGDGLLTYAKFKNNKTQETSEYRAEDGGTFGIFVFIGYAPQTKLFRGVVELDKQGYILADENLMTNVDGVYVAGDVRPKRLKQLVTAVSDGAIVATNLEKYVTDKREKFGIIREEKEVVQDVKEKVLDDGILSQIEGLVDRFEKRVKVVVIRDIENKEKSDEVLAIVRDVASVTEKIVVETFEKGENLELEEMIKPNYYPMIAFFDEKGEFKRIKYDLAPGGHELTSFLLALYNVAGPGQDISKDIKSEIEKINKPINIKIGVSLSCTKCPDTVQSAQRIAILNPNINLEVIDVLSFREFKEKHDIMSVPAIILNDKEIFFGQKDVKTLVSDLLEKI